jgi:uncharacterized protein (DUF1778 family)
MEPFTRENFLFVLTMYGRLSISMPFFDKGIVMSQPRHAIGRKPTPPSEMVSIRVPSAKLALIDAAAETLGKSRTTFLLETSFDRAEKVILDQRAFSLDQAQADALEAIFTEPPAPTEALRRLMASRAPWE